MAPHALMMQCKTCTSNSFRSRRPAFRSEPFKPVHPSRQCATRRSIRAQAAAPEKAQLPPELQAIVDEADDFSLDGVGGTDLAIEAELKKLLLEVSKPEDVIASAEAAFSEETPMVLTEEEADLYTKFENTAKEVIGTIKDDIQADIGIPAAELITADEAEAAVDDVEGLLADIDDEELLEDDDVEDDEDDDDDDVLVSGGGNTLDEVARYVESLSSKFELEEKLDDAIEQAEAAANPAPENLEYDEVDAFFNDFIPGLEDKLPEYPPPEYKLNFLYLDNNIGVAVDQVYAKGQKAPLTEYFFWPKRDAWDDLKASLESRPWISERDKVILLNRTTEVINFWQDEEVKHTVDEARAAFPDCTFSAKS